MIVVSDTSPVRGLVIIEHDFLLRKLFTAVVVPRAVDRELRKNIQFSSSISRFLEYEWVQIKELNEPIPQFLQVSLDNGEAEAIVLAKKMRAEILLMDENKGRVIAESMNLPVMGTVGVLMAAKKRGYISQVKPLLNALIKDAGFYLKESFVEEILFSVNE